MKYTATHTAKGTPSRTTCLVTAAFNGFLLRKYPATTKKNGTEKRKAKSIQVFAGATCST